MNIIFLGGLYTDTLIDYVKEQSSGPIQNAADVLQKNYIYGILTIRDEIQLDCVNLPFVGSYPTHFKNVSFTPVNKTEYIYDTGRVHNIQFNNMKGIKNFARMINALFAVLRIAKDNRKYSVVCYSMHLPFLLACYLTRLFKLNCKYYVIVPDLPEYMSERHGVSKVINKWINKISYFIVNRSNGAVFITEQMATRFSPSLPYTVIEGITAPQSNTVSDGEDWWYDGVEKKKYFLYSGTLDRRYGIRDLIEAYIQAKIANFKLVICGDGNERNYVEAKMMDNKDIIYLGQIEHYKVKILQSNAALLINPRSNDALFTKFSFPSKVIEYMNSGVPTLMYNLDGFPYNYSKYFFHIDSLNDFSSKLKEISEMDEIELCSMGNTAKKFINENSNPQKQVRKLISLLGKN
ncbi:glycosyltransferase [Shewanella xiamenensis]|uniref:glycosyltransferase n=1 Tax=Shewanella xiamenensis TaxID=332186 RepID=UPI0024A6B6BF|nr:glycosyltransferase [Shewanella xiamenensis]MDI5836506.1 glycosyltransferase [Shewanella xiamenensis]MDI5840763.1 glycosyltransferase [Shewanella xiamenensis]MDI5844746.1 glycosyltransferase [Shewanella xiamenensis]MDI5848721.1 glycosyltransferase [Shewanella xiamenensis]MDI5852609.1 glycosyltransferase [Shewanella xiamenensis]